MKTRLALSMRVTSAHNYDELRDSISHDWLMLCQEWNYEIVLVPNYISDPVQYINQFNINGLILTGGDDIGAHQIRDQTEIEMLKYAINKKLPILGICRGLQLINFYFGGKTTPIRNHINIQHKIDIKKPFDKIYSNWIVTNSYHQQGVELLNIGIGLTGWAFDAEGWVEALYHNTHPIIGLMWHPERDKKNLQDKILIDSLLEGKLFWL